MGWGWGRTEVRKAVKKNTFLAFLTLMWIFLETVGLF